MLNEWKKIEKVRILAMFWQVNKIKNLCFFFIFYHETACLLIENSYYFGINTE